ncbi:tripartite tricarboxylate transporter substrate binding protein [Pseudooceanicola pacificus]|nr:tripartite tricarboxylate transporter substrate binding protein [Pseudooceanicola pacificus]
MLTKFIRATCAVFALVLPGAVQAADFPAKPITMIVPYQAGGSIETMGRVFAEEMGGALGTKIILKTQPGAGGKIGTTAASKAAADGYTILFAPDLTVMWPPIAEEVEYSLDSFDPIATVAETQMAIVASKKSGFKTLNDLIAASQGDSLSYADQNAISRAYINFIAKKEGLDWIAVPTKGGGEMVPFLLGGKVDFAWSGGAHNRYLDDMVVLLGMTSEPLLASPDVPLMKDVYGVSMPAGASIWAPAGLPEDVRAALTEAAVTAAKSDAFVDLLVNKLSFPTAELTGDDLDAALSEVDANLRTVFESTK